MEIDKVRRGALLLKSYEQLTGKLEEFKNTLTGPLTIKFDGKRAGGSTWSILTDVDDATEAEALIGSLKEWITRRRDDVVRELTSLGIDEPTHAAPIDDRSPREREFTTVSKLQ